MRAPTRLHVKRIDLFRSQRLSTVLYCIKHHLDNTLDLLCEGFPGHRSRTTVDMTLASLTRSGKRRPFRRGFYDQPRVNSALGGELGPNIEETARAIARTQR